MSDNNGENCGNHGIPDVSGLRATALALCVPVATLVAIVIAAALLSGCESTGPAYDPETTCMVDTARSEIICRDKP